MKNTIRGWGVFGFVTLAFGAQAAYALPMPKPGQQPVSDRAALEMFGVSEADPVEFELPEADDAVNFTAIIALSNCSASLVRLETSLPTDKALVLTNGHCNAGGFLDPGEFLVDQPSSRTMRLLSKDGQTTLAQLRAERIVYGTMTKTDMLIYRLTETYAEIEAKTGTVPLTFRSKRAEPGRPIAVVSGYWRKIYRCSLDRFVNEIREDDWTWVDSLRYKQPGCETIGGTSGSPVVDAETREVIGVNNTGNEDGENCTMNNPCEIDADGQMLVEKGSSYGQQTYWLYGCMTLDNQLDLTKEGCQLPH